MFEGLSPATALLASSPWALLALTFFLIITGKLIPRSTMQDVIADRDAWRDAHRVSEQARIEQAAQVAEMLAGLETVQGMIRALPPAPQSPRGGRR